MTFCKTSTAAAALMALALPALADGELNLYSSRHYDTDERLYSDSTASKARPTNCWPVWKPKARIPPPTSC